MTLLTEDQKRQISSYISDFCQNAYKYNDTKNVLNETEKLIENKKVELSEVAREERQLENAMAVLYVQPKNETKVTELEKDIEFYQKKAKTLQEQVYQLRTKILELMRNLPIPADLDQLHKNSISYFPYLKGTEIGADALLVMSELLRQKTPLQFNEISLLADKIIIDNVSEKQEAINKLVEGVQSFRLHVDNLLKSYEKIDVLIERLTNSTLYSDILLSLFERKRMSVQNLADTLHVDDRKVYDSCYNLTRSNWSPNPIQKTESGEWELTLAGEILAGRLLEKKRGQQLVRDQQEIATE